MSKYPGIKSAILHAGFGLVLVVGLPAFASDYSVGANCQIDADASTPVNITDVIQLKQIGSPADYGLDLISTKELFIPALGTFVSTATAMMNVTLVTFVNRADPTTVAILQTDDSPGKVNRRGKFKAQLVITNVGAVNPVAGAFVGNTLFYRLKCKVAE